MKIKILLVDDHKIVLDGLRKLLEQHTDMVIVGEAENGRAAVSMSLELKPDVVIMDITMSDMNGIEATRRLLGDSPKIKVIALSMHSDRRFVAEMLNAGVSGYLYKDCAYEELVHAIRAVVGKQIYLSPRITGILVEDYKTRLSKPETIQPNPLTPREREALQLLAEGKSTKEIAAVLGVSDKTIETYRQQVMKKLNLHSVAQLTKYAIREGMTTLDT